MNTGEKIKTQQPAFKLGWPRQSIHPDAEVVYANVTKNDCNHVAFTSRLKLRSTPTRTMSAELEVIEWFLLLHGQPGLHGEMVSGATEGTLTALYAFREHAKSIGKSLTVVISPLTHYSVKKSCRILSLSYIVVNIDNLFGLDISELELALDLIQEGGGSAVVVSTLGYTQTGTRDPISDIANICQIRNGTGLNCYHHIDAAIGGLVAPFLGDSCLDGIRGIDSITTDFHKFGWCPYGTGLLLLRNDCRVSIAEPVPYVQEVTDTSILSSRSSLPALAAHAVIRNVSHAKWTSILEGQIVKRDRITECIRKLPSFKVVSSPPSLPFICFSVDNGAEVEHCLTRTFCIDGFHLPGIKGTAFRLYISDQIQEDDLLQIIDLLERLMENSQ